MARHLRHRGGLFKGTEHHEGFWRHAQKCNRAFAGDRGHTIKQKRSEPNCTRTRTVGSYSQFPSMCNERCCSSHAVAYTYPRPGRCSRSHWPKWCHFTSTMMGSMTRGAHSRRSKTGPVPCINYWGGHSNAFLSLENRIAKLGLKEIIMSVRALLPQPRRVCHRVPSKFSPSSGGPPSGH